MPTFRLHRFSRPEVLRSIAPERLLTFLSRHADYFRRRGTFLPNPISSAELDYDKLVRVFMSPDEETPCEVIHTLQLVDEMATEQGMQDLIVAARDTGLRLDLREDDSPADVALVVWLQCAELLEHKHAEQFLLRHRSFEYFQTDEQLPAPFRTPDDAVRSALEQTLATWFADHNRGRLARVLIFEKDESVWFMVRHGEPYKREESLKGTEPSSISYRPLAYDVLVYDCVKGELRIHAQLQGVKELYRKEFGRHFFGRENYFPNAAKYTLDPIRRDGEACLTCTDIAGIDSVRLREVHLDWGGPNGEYEVRKATDLFKAMKHRGIASLPHAPRMARAVFSIKFSDAKRARSVAVRPPNVALFIRDEDSARVDEWLAKRGFVEGGSGDDGEVADPIVVIA